jgi:hypothetical protein
MQQLFTFAGFIQIAPSDDLDLTQPGIQVKFVLGADDNARLRIGGLTIMETTAVTALRTFNRGTATRSNQERATTRWHGPCKL